MANFTAADVKRLRDATAAGMLDCKKALEECQGDMDQATIFNEPAVFVHGGNGIARIEIENAIPVLHRERFCCHHHC